MGGYFSTCATDKSHRLAGDFGSVCFMYLGRRGALGRFCFELAAATREIPALKAHFVLSSSNSVVAQMRNHGSAPLEIDTFSRLSSANVFTSFFRAQHRLLTRLRRERPDAIVNL